MGTWVAILIALGSISGSVFAADTAALRKMFQEANLEFEWPEVDGKKIKTRIESGGPGQLTLFRSDDPAAEKIYKFKVTATSMVTADMSVVLKSTTCPNVPANLKCRIDFGIPGVTYRFISADDGKPGHTGFLPVYKGDFGEHSFPELLPLAKMKLHCSNWTWAQNQKSHKIEILHGGIVSDNYNRDLMMNNKNQSEILPEMSCDPNSGCDLQSHATDTPFFFVFDQVSWYLEIKTSPETACTAEFQTRGSDVFARFRDQMGRLPKLGASYNTSQFLSNIQDRFSNNLVEDYLDFELEKNFKDSIFSSSNISVGSTSIKVHHPWLSLLNIIESRRSSRTGTEAYKIMIDDKFGKQGR